MPSSRASERGSAPALFPIDMVLSNSKRHPPALDQLLATTVIQAARGRTSEVMKDPAVSTDLEVWVVQKVPTPAAT